ncbi:3-deoxy-manno-octulosonate cytidylyltransferase [Pseudomonas sp. NPDC089743]|uniref:3-deoxy-manno-octulosonate cytidylyltransferase n=1 Tax=Pseudomonas sp. NPDC089743 TaxID=3364471 RepID=UPI0038251B79
MKTVIVIPARYKSSRYPGKPLVPLLGKPMILWVAELCAKAVPKSDVYIATDDQRIGDVVSNAGFNVVYTSENALTGTDRVAEFALKVKADFYINVQGDEPLIDPQDIINIIEQKRRTPSDIVNGYCCISEDEDVGSVNIPKVIFTEDGRMIYMSRSAIPGYKTSENKPASFFKQVCIYAFGPEDLRKYSEFNRKSTLEQSEDIEILRFLEWGATIRMVKTSPGTYAVDVPSDVDIVEKELRKIHHA